MVAFAVSAKEEHAIARVARAVLIQLVDLVREAPPLRFSGLLGQIPSQSRSSEASDQSWIQPG